MSVLTDRLQLVRSKKWQNHFFFPNGAFKSLKLQDHVTFVTFHKTKTTQWRTSEPEVITIDLSLLHESDVIRLDEEIPNVQMVHDFIRDEEQGRGLHTEEIRPDQGTPEMTTESNSIGQEEQGEYVTDVSPETQTREMLHNNSNDSEVTVGASPEDPSELDDTLPWGHHCCAKG